MTEIRERVKAFIEENKDSEKAKYDSSLVESRYDVKGVDKKKLEAFAIELAGEGVKFENLPKSCHDEILLAGLVIAHSNMRAKTKVAQLKKYFKFVDNWSTCDAIAPRMSGMESEREFFVELLSSKNPFEIRFALVWFKKFELKDNLVEVVNLINEKVDNTTYFVDMGLAWIYFEALLLDYDYILEFIQTLKRYVIRNRVLQKASESARISDERKQEIKQLRSKLLGIDIEILK